MMVRDVINATVRASGLDEATLLGPSRCREHARPRQVGVYLSHRLTTASNSKIGRLWGGRDRTTTREAISLINRLRDEDDLVVINLLAAVLQQLGLDGLPSTRPGVADRPLLLSRIAVKQRELAQLQADLAAFDAVHFPEARV